MTMISKVRLLALTILFTIMPMTLSETLVMTAFVDHPNFAVVEFTACTTIANFNAYSFFDYGDATSADPFYIYVGDDYASIPSGTKIYVATSYTEPYGLDPARFNAFFGFTPPHLYFSDSVSFYGNDTLQLVKGDTTVVDTYGTVLQDFSGTEADYSLGWATRKSGKSPSAKFNLADWIVTPGEYADLPATNSLASNPVVLGAYSCGLVIKVPKGYCFSESNTVEVEGKGVVSIKDLEIGDKVKDANGNMVSVYSFGHFQPNAVAEYLQIYVKGLGGKPLEVSKDHLLFVNGTTIPASTVAVGDEIDVDSSSAAAAPSCVTTTRSRVEKIRTVTRKGVYAPFTTSGSIVVSGVVASSYVTLQPDSAVLELGDNNNNKYPSSLSMHWLCHVFQTPHRWLCSYVVGMSNCRKWETYNDDGMAQWMVRPHHVMSSWLNGQDRGMVMTAMVFPTFVFPFVLGLMLHAMEVAEWMLLVFIALVAAITLTGRRVMKKGTTPTTKRVGC